VVTGFVDQKKIGYVDGVYVIPRWRRQYWGTTLLDAICDELKGCGASQVRIPATPNETRTMALLHNAFWRTGIYILTKDESEHTLRWALRSLFSEFREEKPGEVELVIPRHLV
jgi:hypothetical protein